MLAKEAVKNIVHSKGGKKGRNGRLCDVVIEISHDYNLFLLSVALSYEVS